MGLFRPLAPENSTVKHIKQKRPGSTNSELSKKKQLLQVVHAQAMNLLIKLRPDQQGTPFKTSTQQPMTLVPQTPRESALTIMPPLHTRGGGLVYKKATW